MNAGTLALLTRSLRVESRSIWTYCGRVVLVAVILFSLGMGVASFGSTGAPGLEFFTTVVMIDVAFITLTAIGFFATCITEEKEDGTLGLLRMTSLSPVAILLGKLGGRLLSAILLILVQIPFTLLAITLGGVSIVQIQAAYIALLAFAFLGAGVGLLVSVVVRRSAEAVGLTMMLTVGYNLAYGFCMLIQMTLRHSGLLVTGTWEDVWFSKAAAWILNANIFVEVYRIFSQGAASDLVTPGVIFNLVAGLAAFLLAWLSFDFFNRHEVAGGAERSIVLWRSKAATRRAPRRVWPGAWAITWKDFYFSVGGPRGLVIRGVLLLLVVGGFFWLASLTNPYNTPTWSDIGGGLFMGSLMLGVAQLAFLANKMFSEEIQGLGTFSGLAILPMPLNRIIYAKLVGNLTCMIPVVLLMAVAWAMSPADIGRGIWEGFFDEGWAWIMLFEGLFFLHLVAALSLYIKWAAIPAALFVTIFCNFCYGMAMAFLTFALRPGERGLMGLGVMLLIVASVFLHIHIGLRLGRLARE